ncbi:MAG: glycosyltransferase family 2 protein [Anaerolineae bacterium]|nr:glycosyltransferase family 2 protein [Anaerolineae bacterium]
MDLSIVVVNWNTRELLAQCLASVTTNSDRQGSNVAILPATYPLESVTYELFVVDNASTDGSAQMVAEHFPWVHLIANSENVGFACANNQAIRQSIGRYILLLNSDTEVHPGALETMVQFMERQPQAGGCGPRLLNADDSLQPSCHPMLTPGREFWRLLFLDWVWRRATYVQERWDWGTPHPVEVIKGACFMLRRAALDRVGLLDEEYFMYTEEMDLCYRLLQDGWQLWWVPQAVVKHYGEASSRQVAKSMYIQLYRSKVQFHRKFGGRRQADCFKRLIFLAYIPRFALARLGSLVFSSYADRAHTYRRLLAELPQM